MRDGVAIGEHAYAGALRFFATGSLDEEPGAEPVLRRYLEAALPRMAHDLGPKPRYGIRP